MSHWQPVIGRRYADAGAYAGKFRALQQRALAAVRMRVSAVLRHASEQASVPCFTRVYSPNPF